MLSEFFGVNDVTDNEGSSKSDGVVTQAAIPNHDSRKILNSQYDTWPLFFDPYSFYSSFN